MPPNEQWFGHHAKCETWTGGAFSTTWRGHATTHWHSPEARVSADVHSAPRANMDSGAPSSPGYGHHHPSVPPSGPPSADTSNTRLSDHIMHTVHTIRLSALSAMPPVERRSCCRRFGSRVWRAWNIKDNFRSLYLRHPKALHALDGMRGLAVLWVVCYHCWLFMAVPMPQKVSPALGVIMQGEMGVDLFFVLSGFLIHFILTKELARTNRIRVVRFLVRRWLRLWPAYLVSFLFYLSSPVETELCEKYGWTNLLMINDLVGGRNRGCMGQTWSIAVEFQFYIISPFVVWLMYSERLTRYRYGPLIVPFVIGAISTALRVIILAHNYGLSYMSPDYWMDYTAVYARVGPYCIGMAASHMYGLWLEDEVERSRDCVPLGKDATMVPREDSDDEDGGLATLLPEASLRSLDRRGSMPVGSLHDSARGSVHAGSSGAASLHGSARGGTSYGGSVHSKTRASPAHEASGLPRRRSGRPSFSHRPSMDGQGSFWGPRPSFASARQHASFGWGHATASASELSTGLSAAEARRVARSRARSRAGTSGLLHKSGGTDGVGPASAPVGSRLSHPSGVFGGGRGTHPASDASVSLLAGYHDIDEPGRRSTGPPSAAPQFLTPPRTGKPSSGCECECVLRCRHVRHLIVAGVWILLSETGPTVPWPYSGVTYPSSGLGKLVKYIQFSLGRTVYGAVVAYFMFQCLTGRARILNNFLSSWPVAAIARLSYSMYLIQFICIIPFTQYSFATVAPNGSIGSVASSLFLLMLTSIPATAMFAFLIYMLVEKPFMNLR